jgi:hypothetical protein
VVEARGRLGFLLKTSHALLVYGYGCRQDFQRHVSAQSGVTRQVHFSHAATAKERENLVLTHDLAGHQAIGRRIGGN